MVLMHFFSSLCADYAVLKGMRSVANMEYRCRLSYNQQGCVLSVHSAREAALICSSHPQCTSFSLSSETTWTGQCLLWTTRLHLHHYNSRIKCCSLVKQKVTLNLMTYTFSNQKQSFYFEFKINQSHV